MEISPEGLDDSPSPFPYGFKFLSKNSIDATGRRIISGAPIRPFSFQEFFAMSTIMSTQRSMPIMPLSSAR